MDEIQNAAERRGAHGWTRMWFIAGCAVTGCNNPPAVAKTANNSTSSPPTAAAAEPASPASGSGGASSSSSTIKPQVMNTPKAPAKSNPQAGTASPPTAAGAAAQQTPTGTASADAGSQPSSASTTLPELCSGCAQEPRDPMDMSVHLHHVHLNVKNREQSAQFYEKYFHAERIMLNGTTEALHVAPTLILLDEQPTAPDGNLPTALQHMGWGAADTKAWYDAAHAQGIEPDTRGFTLFNTDQTPTVGDPGSGAIISLSGAVPACFVVPDVASYMYVLGPDQERIEIWSGADGRVNHMHFTAADLAATSDWYQKFFGLAVSTALLSYQFFMDDILFFYEQIGAAADYKPTDDHTLGHVALAVADLDAWRRRVQQQNIEVVSEPAAAHGFTSFFVRGPDGLLIELVQAAKNTELCPK